MEETECHLTGGIRNESIEPIPELAGGPGTEDAGTRSRHGGRCLRGLLSVHVDPGSRLPHSWPDTDELSRLLNQEKAQQTNSQC